jgi:hypothetical protein
MRGTALAILVVGLCGSCAAQKVRFSPASRSEVLQRAKNTPASNQDRARQLMEWFRQAGCKGSFLSEQKVDGSEIPNVVCRMKGKSEDTIVVAAHYDRVISPRRPFDNWTGSVLLPALYQCLRTRRRRHTMLFVAFADHGEQISGAKAFADQLTPAELKRMKAMVNLDALGLSPTKVWTGHSDKQLVQALMTMVYAMKIPASQIDIPAAGRSDSDPFLARGIPQITIHSLTQTNLIGGKVTPFEPSSFYDSYRLICGFIAYLDENRKLRTH